MRIASFVNDCIFTESEEWKMEKRGNVRIWYDLPVPMRDGTVLYADVYRPDDDEKYPAILNRTPLLM